MSLVAVFSAIVIGVLLSFGFRAASRPMRAAAGVLATHIMVVTFTLVHQCEAPLGPARAFFVRALLAGASVAAGVACWRAWRSATSRARRYRADGRVEFVIVAVVAAMADALGLLLAHPRDGLGVFMGLAAFAPHFWCEMNATADAAGSGA